MKFYLLKISLEKGNMGLREQNEPGYDWDHPHSQGKLLKGFPDFEPRFSALLLGRGSKAVDFVEDSGAIGGKGLMLSPRAKDILLEYRLPEHRIYPIVHKHRKSFEVIGQYFWMQLLYEQNHEWIDFEDSTWIKQEYFGKNPQEINLLTGEEYLKTRKGLPREERIVSQYIKLKESQKENILDLFYLAPMKSALIISERLMHRLSEEKVSGLLEFNQAAIGFE